VPLGCLAVIATIAHDEKIDLEIIDRRCKKEAESIGEFSFNGTLRDYQQRAVDKALRYSCGIICAPGGSGKTVMALNMIQRIGYKTLVLVHTKDLMQQWADRIEEFLNLKPTFVGAGMEDYSGDIVIGMLQTLAKRFELKKPVDTEFGTIVGDEIHHIPARTFRYVISNFYPRYLYGLTATPERSDGLQNMMFRLVGPILHTVTDKELIKEGKKIIPIVRRVYTKFAGRLRGPTKWQKLYEDMASDEERNRLILEMALSEPDRYHLIISKRVFHVELLYDFLVSAGMDTGMILGSSNMSIDDRKRILDLMREGKIHYLVATDRLAAEALDIPRLDRIHIAIPTAFSGATIQQIGRIQRPFDGKQDAIIYDYYDINCDVMYNIYKKRLREIYQAKGWHIQDVNRPGQMGLTF